MSVSYIELRVVNRPGVLNRITQVVLKPRYNIDSLTLVATDDPKVSVITVGIRFEDEAAASLLTKQLAKQVDVLSGVVLDKAPTVTEGEAP